MERYPYLEGFTFKSCVVRSRRNLFFPAQRIEYSDPLESWLTAVFMYYPDKPDSRKWAVRTTCETGEVYGCAVGLPEERSVLVNGDGETFVIGGGVADWEEPVTTEPAYFRGVKTVRGGRAYAIQNDRPVVHRRDGPNEWTRLDEGFGDADVNLRDLDGFADDDLYACGARGELWHYDGARWGRISVATESDLQSVCCASDGRVIVTTGSGAILVGRGDGWSRIEQDHSRWLGDVVESEGQVIILAEGELYALDGDRFEPADLGVPEMKTRGYLSARDGVLLIAGQQEFCYRVDGQWHQPLEAPEQELLWR